MDREQRVFARCQVRFDHLERQVLAESEDLSRRGVFVRTDKLLPVGDIVELEIILPGNTEFRVIARVAHLLSPSVARALGRRTGMGFEFLEHDNEGRDRLAQYLEDLIEEFTPLPTDLPHECRVLIAEPSEPLAARLRTSLTLAGFLVETVTTGAEAYTRSAERPPDIILAAVRMPVMDGWTMMSMMSAHPVLRGIPVLLMDDDASDMTRLEAYRAGVSDFVHKPFTDEEIAIRLRRVALTQRTSQGVMLRGNLAEISLGTLLSLLEFERKSGILVLLRDLEAARLFMSEGRLVKIEGPSQQGDPLSKVMSVLDWNDGNFEFTRCEVVGSDEVGLPTSHLLLEHARLQDERR